MSSGIGIIFIIGCLAIIKVNALLSAKNTTDSKKIPEDCSVCGISVQKAAGFPMIIGGTPVKHSNTYPWLVRVEYKKCTGAIIDAFYVLTAAHCVMKKNKVHEVFFQIPSLNPEEGLNPAIAIEKIIVHPKFGFVNAGNYSIGKYDIALVKLKQRIKCDEYKNPICLPDADFKLSPGARSIIAGWGVAVFGNNDGDTDFFFAPKFDLSLDQLHMIFAELGFEIVELKKSADVYKYTVYKDAPMVLRHGSVKHFDFEECIRVLPGTKQIKDHVLCEGGTKQLTCSGDSGSPLVHKIKQKYYVVGVNSASTCSDDGVNDHILYTNVVKCLDWINKEIKEPSSLSFPIERKQNQNPKCTGGKKKQRKQNKNKAS